jgi:acyl-homoserine lactone acylase PvdQ
MRGSKVAAVLVATVLSIAAGAPIAHAAVPVAPYGAGDESEGGFRDVLPPGTNGMANLVQLGAFLTTGARPAHNSDQLSMYADLVRATPGLTDSTMDKYFKDATFGVRPNDVASTASPRADVTIVRDKGFGVPHIYGATRGGAMFGAGYAAGQDRLFFIDVLRHLGRGQLSSFAGGAPGNRAMGQEQWSLAPYTEDDLQHQVDQFDDLYGADGVQLQNDLADYVAGINAYINEAKLDPTKMPGEYAATNHPLGPDVWRAPTSSPPPRWSARSSARAAVRSSAWPSSSSASRTASATPTAARSGASSPRSTTPTRRRRSRTRRSPTRRRPRRPPRAPRCCPTRGR